MKDRKEEILDNVCKKSYKDAGEVWNGQKHDYRRFQILLAMEQYAMEMAVGFCDWLDTHKYEFETLPSDILYQQYLESIK